VRSFAHTRVKVPTIRNRSLQNCVVWCVSCDGRGLFGVRLVRLMSFPTTGEFRSGVAGNYRAAKTMITTAVATIIEPKIRCKVRVGRRDFRALPAVIPRQAPVKKAIAT
jgi:hypothetical protein